LTFIIFFFYNFILKGGEMREKIVFDFDILRIIGKFVVAPIYYRG